MRALEYLLLWPTMLLMLAASSPPFCITHYSLSAGHPQSRSIFLGLSSSGRPQCAPLRPTTLHPSRRAFPSIRPMGRYFSPLLLRLLRESPWGKGSMGLKQMGLKQINVKKRN